MAKIFPFRAYRYSPRAGDPANLLTQPYDKISPKMQQHYQTLSPYNLIHLIRPDSYNGAAQRLGDWVDQGILVQDPEPALFAYFQKFHPPDLPGTCLRKGLIALGEVVDYSAGVVFRHELTHAGPKRDRLELLRHTRNHCEQLFLLYDDPQAEIDALLDQATQADPLTRVIDEYGAEHSLWPIRDPQTIATIQSLLAPHRLLIADGHHRYETAMAFRNENPDLPGADRVMMTLVNMCSPGLVILPTHRVLFGLPGFDPARILREAQTHFTVEEIGSLEALRGRLREASPGHVVIGALLGGRCYALRAQSSDLDVSVLHNILLTRVVGLSPEAVRDEQGIRYVRGFHEAARAAEAQAVFFLNPVRVDQVADVAFSGGVMPQKSTDFYPKLLSGITIYRLE
jgi:uncharacterized protein (DUF1015 family)